MEVAIPQLQEEGDSWEPVSWQPGDTKESMISNFGRIRYQVGTAVEATHPHIFQVYDVRWVYRAEMALRR